MILYKLNTGQANAVRGNYKHAHDCEPIFIQDKFWILYESIDSVVELLVKVNFNAFEKFESELLNIEGEEEDENAVIYQDWIDNNNTDIILN